MAPIGRNDLTSSVQELSDNTESEFLDASEILLKLANNILNNPGNSKFRSIRVGNPKIMTKLLPVNGAMQCLFDMGFQENGEFLTLPENAPLGALSRIRDEIVSQRQRLQAGSQASTLTSTQHAASAGEPAAASPVARPAIVTGASAPVPSRVQVMEQEFYAKLKSSYLHVLLYENQQLQEQARRCIPVQQLEEQARQTFSQVAQTKEGEAEFKDFLLLELLRWFKEDFFQWMDAPPCDSCGGSTQGVGNVEPSDQEKRWMAGRVENYWCGRCQTHTRFPRYNHPGKLLKTRKGRCGEWANCFTLCCRAMGFDARFALDWTDHVWTEVYSDSQKRWLHCDPCENVCDKPLLYEAGWGKPLTYVIAFSCEDIQDVTWRYTSKFTEVLSRRVECRESWLLSMIMALRKQRQEHMTAARKQVMQDRLIAELIEFMTPRTPGDGEMGGRLSGSLAWKLARGEAGSNPTEASKTVIHLSDEEKQEQVLRIQYCSATDEYCRGTANTVQLKGWRTFVFEAENMMRKVEHDWKKSYLARAEGSPQSTISWKFDFQGTGLVIDKVEIRAETSCFETGRVHWKVCTADQCVLMPSDTGKHSFDDLRGSETLTLRAELSGGVGSVAWQHTQLFRQELHEKQRYPLDVTITLKSAM